jgi:hypothetical protein
MLALLWKFVKLVKKWTCPLIYFGSHSAHRFLKSQAHSPSKRQDLYLTVAKLLPTKARAFQVTWKVSIFPNIFNSSHKAVDI